MGAWAGGLIPAEKKRVLFHAPPRTPSQYMRRKFYKIHGLLACVHPPTVLLALGFFNQVPPMLSIRLLYPGRRYPLRCDIAVPRSMENPTHRQDDIRLVMTVLEKGRIL